MPTMEYQWNVPAVSETEVQEVFEVEKNRSVYFCYSDDQIKRVIRRNLEDRNFEEYRKDCEYVDWWNSEYGTDLP